MGMVEVVVEVWSPESSALNLNKPIQTKALTALPIDDHLLRETVDTSSSLWKRGRVRRCARPNSDLLTKRAFRYTPSCENSAQESTV